MVPGASLTLPPPQVDVVCHGKTEIVPDRDGSDPYQVGRAGPEPVPVWGTGVVAAAAPRAPQPREAGC